MKTTDIHKPRPTTYRGVRFRSKCEAIFARALDLMEVLWEYEPRALEIESGWRPDFWVVLQGKKGLEHWVIEYKPGSVTESYREELAERFFEIKMQHCFGSYLLVVANPFNEGEDSMLEYLQGTPPDFIWTTSPDTWKILSAIDAYMRQSIGYRFDLA